MRRTDTGYHRFSALFRQQLPEVADQLRRLLGELEAPGALEALRRRAHQLAGSGGVFGCPGVAQAALALCAGAVVDGDELQRLGRALLEQIQLQIELPKDGRPG